MVFDDAGRDLAMLPLVPQSHLDAPPDPTKPLRLMEIVRRVSRERRYSARTEQAYAHWIRRFVLFHGRRHPKDLGAEHVREFLSALAVEAGVSASTQNQALAAITFLYDGVLRKALPRIDGIAPAKRPHLLPVVLSQAEVRAILRRLDAPLSLCAQLMYGGGLRLSECVSLRIKDVDIDRREITVRSGKGGKDRRTPLPQSSIDQLRRHLEIFGGRDHPGPTHRSAHDRHSRVAAPQVSDGRLRLALAVCIRGRADVRRRRQNPPPAPSARERPPARVQGRGRRRRRPQARVMPYPPPLVRDAPDRIWFGHPDRPGAPWPFRRPHDDGLHARLEPRRTGVRSPADNL